LLGVVNPWPFQEVGEDFAPAATVVGLRHPGIFLPDCLGIFLIPLGRCSKNGQVGIDKNLAVFVRRFRKMIFREQNQMLRGRNHGRRKVHFLQHAAGQRSTSFLVVLGARVINDIVEPCCQLQSRKRGILRQPYYDGKNIFNMGQGMIEASRLGIGGHQVVEGFFRYRARNGKRLQYLVPLTA
jgi:hypothetical protein